MIESGLHLDVPAPEYHSWPAASNSLLSHLRRSPAHAKWAMENPSAPTPALITGDAVDCLVFTPERFSEKFAVAEQCRAFTQKKERCTRIGSGRFSGAWYCSLHSNPLLVAPGIYPESEPSFQVITEEQQKQAGAMAQAVNFHPGALLLLEACEDFQVSAVWRENNITCKGRFDGLSEKLKTIIDLKTTIDASPESFSKAIFNFGYHRQAAMYMRAAAALKLDIQHFVIIAVEKEPPYAVATYRLNEYCLDYGKMEVLPLLDKWEECCTTNQWPSYPEEPIEIGLPPWAERQIERRRGNGSLEFYL